MILSSTLKDMSPISSRSSEFSWNLVPVKIFNLSQIYKRISFHFDLTYLVDSGSYEQTLNDIFAQDKCFQNIILLNLAQMSVSQKDRLDTLEMVYQYAEFYRFIFILSDQIVHNLRFIY
jgi:hypothetical protein